MTPRVVFAPMSRINLSSVTTARRADYQKAFAQINSKYGVTFTA